jgi:hypothetical protein
MAGITPVKSNMAAGRPNRMALVDFGGVEKK